MASPAMNGLFVFVLVSSLRLIFAAGGDRNDTEAVDRPTLATEMSKAVTECNYPETVSNRSYADMYNASHHAADSQPPRDSRHGRGWASKGGRGEDSASRGVDVRPEALGEHFFLKTAGRTGDDRDEMGRRERDKRSTYDSRSTNLPACTVQCVFTRLDVVDDQGYVTESGVVALLDNYVIDRAERLAKTRRAVGCFRKLGAAVEDDHCAHARKMARCLALDMNQRPQPKTNGTREH